MKNKNLDISDYQKNGYLIVEKALSQQEVDNLCAEAAQVCLGNRGEIDGSQAFTGLSDTELLRQIIAIHFPHKLSDVLKKKLSDPVITEVLTRIIGPNVKCMQSMFFVKQAGRPGQAWHQDETFIPTRDRSMTGVWIALDKATVDNGCLWVIPGSHKKWHPLAWQSAFKP